MSVEGSRRYEQLSPKSYEHPADRAATAALGSIPLMDKVIKRLTDVAMERRLRQLLIGNAVRLGPNQIPDVFARYTRAGQVLDLGSLPDLYVTQTPFVNALTVGAQKPVVVVYSSLLGDYHDDEVEAVLGHELGHVLSEHYYYTTAYVLLAQFLAASAPGPLAGLPIRAMYLVLLEWSRAAELSADRASALVTDDPQVTCRMLMRMAGGALAGMDLDAFVQQATEYEEESDLFARWNRAWMEISLRHPFAVRRVKELVGWVAAGDFDRIRSGSYVRKGQEPPTSKEFADAVRHYRDRFMAMLDRTTGGVQRLVSQLEDWLRGSGDDDADPADG